MTASASVDGSGAHRLLVVYADGPDGPLPDPSVVEGMLGAPVEVVLGWVVRTPPWAAGAVPAGPGAAGVAGVAGGPDAPVTTLMLGAGMRRPVAAGRVRAVATRLSAFPGLLAGRLCPDVAVVGATEWDGGWRLVGSPGWAFSAVRAARSIVVERWPAGTSVPAPGPALPDCDVAGVIERADPPDPPPDNRSSPAHLAIGRRVAALLPDDATVQWGPGAIGAAVMEAVEHPVAVRSGLVTDELVSLARRGLLVGPAKAAYLWGGPELHAMVGDGRLQLCELSHTHDLSDISATPRFVAINTALQVGLDGAANVEKAGGRLVSGPGGHPDFAAGASRSPGGLSIVALTATSGGRSNIVAHPEVVSTPRSDVDVVVTEYGVADLRGLTDRERAQRLIAVAAPEHRSALEGAGGEA